MSFYGRLNSGLQVDASISPATEIDTYQTYLMRGLTYEISARGADSGDGSLGDPVVWLYDSWDKLVANADDMSADNRNAQIVYTPPSSGQFFVEVAEEGRDATGSYNFSISPGYASNRSDKVYGGSYGDAIAGMDGNDELGGMGGKDYLYGQDGNDTLRGGVDIDELAGGDDRDLLRGQEGGDRLIGGTGADVLVGGQGPDRFVFNSTRESNPTDTDRIIEIDDGIAFEGVGRTGGDRINVSGIDADETVDGNQTFSFAFGALTQRRAQLYEDNGDTIFVASTDRDTAPEVMIRIEDGSIRATDYTLDEFML